MNAARLQLHEYYLIDGRKARYMGRSNDNQYIFYDAALKRLVFDDTELYVASIEPVLPSLAAAHTKNLK